MSRMFYILTVGRKIDKSQLRKAQVDQTQTQQLMIELRLFARTLKPLCVNYLYVLKFDIFSRSLAETALKGSGFSV